MISHATPSLWNPLEDAEARFRFESHIRALEAFGHRGSATSNEHAAAEYLVDELKKLGLSPNREAFRSSRSLALRCLLHALLAAVGGYFLLSFPILGATVALVALTSLWAEHATRGMWLSRLIAWFPSSNVVAQVPAARRQRRLVLCAHYDTQQSGLIWFLFQYLAPFFWILPTWLKSPLLSLALLMLGQIALAAAAWFAIRDVVALWHWLMGLYVVFLILLGEWALHRHVPGAGDNASGVAAILTYVEAWTRGPHDEVELYVLFTGCEEAGLVGAIAWADRHAAENAAVPTSFLIMDNLGFGTPRYLGVEIPLCGVPVPYPPTMLAAAEVTARELSLSEAGPWAIPAPGDALAFLQRGLSGMSVLSFHPWGFMPYYHLMGDTSQHLDFDAAWSAVHYGWRLLLRIANEAEVEAAPVPAPIGHSREPQ